MTSATILIGKSDIAYRDLSHFFMIVGNEEKPRCSGSFQLKDRLGKSEEYKENDKSHLEFVDHACKTIAEQMRLANIVEFTVLNGKELNFRCERDCKLLSNEIRYRYVTNLQQYSGQQ